MLVDRIRILWRATSLSHCVVLTYSNGVGSRRSWMAPCQSRGPCPERSPPAPASTSHRIAWYPAVRSGSLHLTIDFSEPAVLRATCSTKRLTLSWSALTTNCGPEVVHVVIKVLLGFTSCVALGLPTASRDNERYRRRRPCSGPHHARLVVSQNRTGLPGTARPPTSNRTPLICGNPGPRRLPTPLPPALRCCRASPGG